MMKELFVNFIDSNNISCELKVNISNRFLKIPAIGFLAVNYDISENSKFILASRDEYFKTVDGNREVVPGVVVYINNDELKVINGIQRPNDVMVAENGNFIINDWMSSKELNGTFYAINSELKILLKKKFNSNLGKNAISENGEYALLETLVSKSEDGNSIFFFDLKNSELLWRKTREYGNIKEFTLDTSNRVLKINYLNNRISNYNF